MMARLAAALPARPVARLRDNAEAATSRLAGPLWGAKVNSKHLDGPFRNVKTIWNAKVHLDCQDQFEVPRLIWRAKPK